jgi:hypothetical protein
LIIFIKAVNHFGGDCNHCRSKLTPEWSKALRSKALHLSDKGVTTDPGLFPGCITTGRDWESHRAAHNWPSVVEVRVWPGLAVIANKNLFLTDLPS